jgi:hypothetical protein
MKAIQQLALHPVKLREYKENIKAIQQLALHLVKKKQQ